jgi:hypothetical protein
VSFCCVIFKSVILRRVNLLSDFAKGL